LAGKLYRSGDFKQASEVLEQALKLETAGSSMAYDLALCYEKLGDREKAVHYLDQVRTNPAGAKRKLQLAELETQFSTGEQPLLLKVLIRKRSRASIRCSRTSGPEPRSRTKLEPAKNLQTQHIPRIHLQNAHAAPAS
jgi:tetratricopeptide (TPR) repeat protein